MTDVAIIIAVGALALSTLGWIRLGLLADREAEATRCTQCPRHPREHVEVYSAGGVTPDCTCTGDRHLGRVR